MPVARKSPYRAASTRAAEARTTSVVADRQAQPEISFYDWSTRVPEPKAGPLNFARFPFQTELYRETGLTREVVVKKATQIGISAYLIRETMYWADVKGWTVLYIFPKLTLMYDFADARVKTLIIGSKYLSSRISREHTANKGLRRIGQGFVYYRGSESESSLESIDADAIALDEYDLLTPENIPVAMRRLTGSEHGLIRRVGVPTTPGWGLDALYEESDQRRWHVQCSHDRKWQPIFYDAGAHPDGELSGYVDEERELVVCGRCHKPLDVTNGEWVPAFPDRDVRGYHASRLIVPAVALNVNGVLGTIIKAHNSTEPFEIQGHHNRDLGEAYAPKEGRLSLEALSAAQADGYRQLTGYDGDRLITMGVDVASTRAINVRISEHTKVGHKRGVWIGTVDNFDEVESLIRAFRVNMFVIDHLPEGRLARSLVAKYPGRGYLCVLTGSQVQKVLNVNDETGTITVRRTEAIDAMMSGIREMRNKLPIDLPEGYVRQMQAPVRYATRDEVGKVVVGYRSSGADDFAFSEVFDVVATEAWNYRIQLGALENGEIVALEDRLEFQRAHLNQPEQAGGYSPGPGFTQGGEGGYSAGFGEGQEPGFDDPYQAWDE